MLHVDAFVESPGTEAIIASESSGVDGHRVLPEVTIIYLLLRDKAEDWKDASFIIGVVFLHHFSSWIPCVASGFGESMERPHVWHLPQGLWIQGGNSCAVLCSARECCQCHLD